MIVEMIQIKFTNKSYKNQISFIYQLINNKQKIQSKCCFPKNYIIKSKYKQSKELPYYLS